MKRTPLKPFKPKAGVKYWPGTSIRIKENVKPIRKISENWKKIWLLTRKICFDKWGKVCFLCGSVENIQVHHWQQTRSQNPSRRTDQTNLIPLCAKCHSHNGADKRFYELKEQIERKLK